ncbi:TIGR02266 family protein [Stigmatella sp. ncwal1]|uniref:TIGR02266 family protein n=1 Tax=Stigmatella ashevillensis TaxID=2995309 RepID=A0ABT5DDI2_9BACT|nr:TIGR02266 family protein [Stigmatella ashevillena]MDC0710387.1 TIGR02266 family protein [Stigmatella ashevillena]
MPTFSLAALWNASAIPGHVAGIVEAIEELLPSTQPVAITVALRENEAHLELKLEMTTFPRLEMDRFSWEIKASKGTLVELWRLPKAERDAFRAAAFSGNVITAPDYFTAARTLQEHLEGIIARDRRPVQMPVVVPPAAQRAPAQAPAPADEPLAEAVDEPLVPGEEVEEEPLEPIEELEEEPLEPIEEVADEPIAEVADEPIAEVADEPIAEALDEPMGEALDEPIAAVETYRAPVTEPPAGPELRRAKRFPVMLEMEFRSELDFVREHATNISNGGLFVRTAHRPPIDTIVKVDVRLPNGESLQGEAMVVHLVDDPYKGGVGLAFLTDDPSFAQTLDDYLASLAGPS